MDVGANSALITIAVALVFIEREGCILASINLQRDDLARQFARVLQSGSRGHDGALAHEEGQLLDGSGGLYGLSSLVELARPVVYPASPGGQIDGAGLAHALQFLGALVVIHRFRDGTNQEGLTPHKLVLHVVDRRVLGKIKGQEPGHGAITHAGVGGQRVVVGQEMVAQAYHAQHTLVERLAGIAQAPYLAGRVGAVAAGERQEGGILEHAGVILPVAQVVHAAVEVASPEPLSPLAGEEGTDVHRPVGATRGHEVQALGYLLAERFPGGMGIAIPGDSTETLLPGVAGAREVDHALAVGGGALVLIEPLGVIKGIEAGALGSQHVGEQLRVSPPSSLMIIPSITLGHGMPVRVERLGAVAPPSVKAVAEELAVGVVPVEGAGLGIESVVDGAV